MLIQINSTYANGLGSLRNETTPENIAARFSFASGAINTQEYRVQLGILILATAWHLVGILLTALLFSYLHEDDIEDDDHPNPKNFVLTFCEKLLIQFNGNIYIY